MSTADRLLRHIPQLSSHASSPEELAAFLGALREETALLAQQEMRLARAELQASAHDAARAGVGLGIAVLVGIVAVAVLAVAAALALSEVLPASVAFLLVGAALALVAVAAFSVGRRHLRAVSPVPHRTIDNIKEDLTWLRTQVS
jgi:hypothetical protein